MPGFMNAASCDGGGGRPPIHKTAAAGAGIRDVVVSCPSPTPLRSASPFHPPSLRAAGRGKGSAPPRRPPLSRRRLAPPGAPQPPTPTPRPRLPQRGGAERGGGYEGCPGMPPAAPRPQCPHPGGPAGPGGFYE